jgi:hypothetical protein
MALPGPAFGPAVLEMTAFLDDQIEVYNRLETELNLLACSA